MFDKIKKAFFGKRKGSGSKKNDHLQQAQLSNDLVDSLNEAIADDRKVYFRIDVDGKTHAFCMNGKNNPLIEGMRDFMDLAANEMVREASRSDMAQTVIKKTGR